MGAPAQELGEALAKDACIVIPVATAAELSACLEEGPCDAVILALQGRGEGKSPLLGPIARALLGARSARTGPAPFVLVLGAPAPSGTAAPLQADAWIEPGEIDRALRELRGGIAVRRLEEARDRIGRLDRAVMHARHTAHELAQPLTTILARTQLLMDKVKQDDPNYRAIRIICEEADRLARLIEDFQKLKEMVRPPSRKARPG